MRAALLCLLLLLAGCTQPDPPPCDAIDATQVVDEVRGTDIVVDNGSLILHTSQADILLREAGTCTPMAVADVQPGDRVGHDAQRIAISDPAQAHPDTVVVEHA